MMTLLSNQFGARHRRDPRAEFLEPAHPCTLAESSRFDPLYTILGMTAASNDGEMHRIGHVTF